MPRLILIVEGPEDYAVANAVAMVNGIGEFKPHKKGVPAPDLGCVRSGGYDNVKKDLGLTVTGDVSVGVIVDADSNLAGRWESLSAVLQEAGYQNLPKDPHAGGTIVNQEAKPTVGIWLWPDNQRNGDLEMGIGEWVSPEDPLWPHSEAVIQGLPNHSARRRSTKRGCTLGWRGGRNRGQTYF